MFVASINCEYSLVGLSLMNMHWRGWRTLLPIMLLCMAAAAPKDEAARRLQQTERERAGSMAAAAASTHAATQALAREAALATQRIQATARLRTIEQRVQDASRQVDDAAAAERAVEAEITSRGQSLSAMLPLALRLSLYPSETLLAAPATPDRAIAGLLATQGVSADLGRQVEALRAKQKQARALAASVAQGRAAVEAERARQNQAASSLDRQISQADQAQARALDEAALAAQSASVLAAQANDLRSAIAAMDAAERRAAQEAARTARAAQAQRHQHVAGAARAREVALARPAGPGLDAGTPRITLVAGHIIRGWAAPSDDGPATGLTYGVAAGAFVASPCAGRVAFAAPFRSYGRLMIIECGGGYDFVLSGMDRLDAAVGRAVRAGEPLGRMAQARTQGHIDQRHIDQEHTGSGGNALNTPLLYVELRKNGQAIDPLPYLNGKP